MATSESILTQQVSDSEMPISIRKMQIADLDRVAKLEKQAFPGKASQKNIAHEVLENSLSFPYVVETKDLLIGYAVYWQVESEAHLMDFAVDEMFRNKQVGCTLLGCLMRDWRSKKIHAAHLEVRSSNQAARNLYLKYGFEVAGVRKNYYSKEKEDAILMSLFLRRD